MSHRHIQRQSDRDVRMHDPPPHSHPHAILTHPPPPPPPPPPTHQPHINGNAAALPTTPALSNGSAHAIVSPVVIPNATASNGVVPPQSSVIHKLAVANEQTWLLIGRVAEQMGDLEHAITAYENALRHNPMSLSGLTQVAGIARIKENYPKAVEYFQRVLQLQEDNGEVWSALGHCYLMQDDLQKAYSAYQQALYLLPNPKEDPKLWYGIGILYDRYGSLDHAEEAFASVLKMDKELDFDKANEILFRLGIIYKQQGKYEESLTCFDRILRNPPSPLAHADIWFQIGHVYEQQKDHVRAKDAYERVVADNPGHAKVLQQLGWLYHQDGSSFQNQELAIQYLTKSLEADPSDAQSWYLLGRAYMAGQKYNKAYEAYQQAVYRDGRNPTFWCSIGVLYFQINQFRDALDAYSRAIRINPYISEVWFDLGSLYESCNNQISDAIDAYARASELDPGNHIISQRLQLLKNAQATGGQLPAAPGPQDVHPTAYASAVVPPPGLTGPPLLLQSTSTRPPIFRPQSNGPPSGDNLHLPPPAPAPASRSSPGPFRGGPPPPVVLDESRHMPSHTPLAPMDVDRPSHPRDYTSSSREGPSRGPTGHQTLLLHHPVPQQQVQTEELRNSAVHGPGQYNDHFPGRPLRVPSTSASPPPPHNSRVRSPGPGYPNYPPSNRQPVGPAQPSLSQRSPPNYPREAPRLEHDTAWDRRGPPPEHHREWERERERRGRPEYPSHPSQQPYYPSRSPGPRGHSPMETSPRSAHPSAHPSRAYWDSKPPSGPPHPRSPAPPGPPEGGHWRYDPAREQERDAREYERERQLHEQRRQSMGFATSPEGAPHALPHHMGSNSRPSESPRPTPVPDSRDRKRKPTKDSKDSDTQSIAGTGVIGEAPKKEKKRRQRRAKDDSSRSDSNGVPSNMPATFKISSFSAKEGPETSSSGSRSLQPSPTSATPRPPSRVVDDDYDEGIETLLNLSQYRPEQSSSTDRGSVSSSRSRPSPPEGSGSLKRPLSPVPDEMDTKRSRVDGSKHSASSPSGSRHTPIPSSRPSPMPFRTQPSHSPDSRHTESHYPTSPPQLAVVLPPHPRPIGPGHASHVSPSAPIALPPIATLSPASSVPSPSDDRMILDSHRSSTPPSRGKLSEVMNPAAGSPPMKPTTSPARSQERTAPTPP
ncbi:TPR-like protein [Suillus bovinus]|uniref:TPR-like protein n=1 Tax=Suillus bovinus TaxID=48563 RepID=UPI001B867E31|nr:TPR-like protein [Suillus bovinus]KAG2160230.1 TPR-like protein [Suillus bovinus]